MTKLNIQDNKSPRKKLSDYLQKFIQEQGLNLKVLADGIGVKRSSLRTEFNRNAFSTITIGKILYYLKEQIKALPSDLDEAASSNLAEMEPELVQKILEDKFEVGVTKSRRRSTDMGNVKARAGAVSVLKERVDLIANIQRFDNAVELLMSELEAGDAYFYMSIDQRPLEFAPMNFELRGRIFDSVMAGAKLHYLFPSAKVTQSLRARGMRDVVRGEDLREEFDVFQKSLENDAKRRGQADVKIKNHLFFHSLNDGIIPFLVPQYKFILFIRNKGKDVECYALVPADERGLNLPQSKAFTNQFISFLMDELGTAELWAYEPSVDMRLRMERNRSSARTRDKELD